ncbi:PAS domain-containing protein, partial [Pseudomonas protegens]|uniref:PAS domain-containing protein n=2 Tax=Pseudomonas TaxID=286 RepID=UPI001071E14D
MKINLPVTGRNVDFAPDANILSTTDLTSAITYANPDFIEISGYTREELLGSPHNLLRHPDMPSAAFGHMWRTLKSGRSWMGMVKNRCKNGDHYWVSAYVTPVTRDGQAVEYQSVRTKPSPQQIDAAERAYARLREGGRSGWSMLPVVSLRLRLWAAISAGFIGSFGVSAWLLPESWMLQGTVMAMGWCLSLVAVGLQMRPLDRLAERARQIGDNPLSQGIYTGRADEFGRIEFALQMLEAQVGAVVGRIG